MHLEYIVSYSRFSFSSVFLQPQYSTIIFAEPLVQHSSRSGMYLSSCLGLWYKLRYYTYFFTKQGVGSIVSSYRVGTILCWQLIASSDILLVEFVVLIYYVFVNVDVVPLLRSVLVLSMCCNLRMVLARVCRTLCVHSLYLVRLSSNVMTSILTTSIIYTVINNL